VRGATPLAPVLMGAVQPLCEIEKAYILAALAHNDGNQTRTAEQLQIGSATLYRKLKSFGMTSERAVPPP
jgi:DNA-binding NtrC family response regulator